MSSSVFLSYPKPYLRRQENFIKKLSNYLKGRGLVPKTLGVTEYDMDAPLTAIRRLMLESNGLIAVAFRRSFIKEGISKPNSDLKNDEKDLSGFWLTSPFCQIEPAMAFQLGLPILVLREKGVIADGVLEHGVLGIYMPEFDLDSDIDGFFKTQEWKQIISKWESYVRKVVEYKGKPPLLY